MARCDMQAQSTDGMERIDALSDATTYAGLQRSVPGRRVIRSARRSCPGGVNFSVFSRHATALHAGALREGRARSRSPRSRFPEEFRIGNVYAMTVFDLDYREHRVRLPHGRARSTRTTGTASITTQMLLDPYAKAIGGRDVWGAEPELGRRLPAPRPAGARRLRLGGRPPAGDPGRGPRHLRDARARLHAASVVRGVKHPGTFAGISREDPVPEGARHQLRRADADLRVRRVREQPARIPRPASCCCNYWGYSTVGFFAPKAGYAATGKLGMQVDEFKTLVKELHNNGIEVILDVVFNHTAEGNERGPTISLPRPRQQDLLHAHAGGLLLQLQRQRQHAQLQQPGRAQLGARLPALLGGRVPHRRLPLRPGRDPRPRPERRAAGQPAAAGDAGLRPVLGQVQADRRGVGRRRPVPGRLVPGLRPLGRVERQVPRHACASSSRATWARSARWRSALQGSPDLYYGRGTGGHRSTSSPATTASRCTTSCRYNDKHNEANGEDNNDGANDNNSWNCGWRRRRPTIRRSTRCARRQMKNAAGHAAGQPGRADDPDGRRGRPHAARQQQHLLPRQRAQLVRLDAARDERRPVALLQQPDRLPPGPPGAAQRAITLRNADYVGSGYPDISWHGTRAWNADWSGGSRVLAFMLCGKHAKGGHGRRRLHLRRHEHALGRAARSSCRSCPTAASGMSSPTRARPSRKTCGSRAPNRRSAINRLL